MRLNWRKTLSLFLFISIILSNGYSSTKDEAQDEFDASGIEATKLAVPEKKDKSFFAGADQDAYNNVLMGSPESLRLAINILKHKGESLNESEKVLFHISVSLMKILWKSIDISENSNYEGQDSYCAAISSARQGIYDFNSGNVDFLTWALPSLVLAVSDSRNDYYQESEEALLHCLSEKKESVFVNYLYGLLCRRTGKLNEARTAFETASQLASGCYEIAYALADINYSLKNYSQALEQAEYLLEKQPSSMILLKLCAQSAFEAGRLEKAELYVNRVLQSEPENGTFVLFRTKILVSRGEYIRAASLLDAYARTDTTSRDYLYLRYTVQKNWNKNITAAASTIEKALELYPDDLQILLAASEIASEGKMSVNGWSGEELADQVLEKDPDNLEAKKIKIQSMVQKKNWAEAYKASSELRKLSLADENIVFNHIKICLAAGRKDEAWKTVSELYSRQSENEAVLQAYIDVLVSTNRRAEASKIINQKLPSASGKMKSFLYYEKSFLSGDENTILSDLRSSLTANPRNSDALFRLYKIYFNKKEYKKAQYYLKQVVALSPRDEELLNLNRQLDKLIKQ